MVKTQSHFFDQSLKIKYLIHPSHSIQSIIKMESNQSSQQIDTTKTPKGTQDFYGEPCKIRNNIMNTTRSIFELFGSQELDTPVFELRETLNGKYGEEGAKLIYNLEDQGGELLSLRYDLTVPMCRYIAKNKLKDFVRHQLQKVYRRDNPRMTLGRFREFYQCDLDIAGHYSKMIVEAEIFSLLGFILTYLGFVPLFNVTIKVNHRKILDGIFRVCGVEDSMIRAVSSAIDKLDKIPWSSSDPNTVTVRKELIEEKGLSEETADMIGKWTCKSGKGKEFLQEILQMEKINENIVSGIKDLMLLEDFMQDDPTHPLILYDLSLARGLDYYTGTIFEAVVSDVPGVGTFAAGGRYDNLVSDLSNGKVSTPCDGMSLGLERVAAILNSALSEEEVSIAQKLEKAGAQTEKEHQTLEKYRNFQKTLPLREKALSNFKGKDVSPFRDSGKTAEICVVRLDKSFQTLRYARRIANILRRELKTSVQFRMKDNPRSPSDQLTEFIKECGSIVAVFVSDKGETVNIKDLINKKQLTDVSIDDMTNVVSRLLM